MSHHYTIRINWTGNTGKGTSDYRSYERSYSLTAAGKPEVLCSSDPQFRGDKRRYNPEELFLASLSSCHMLQYLHLCADAGVVVVTYEDRATGLMIQTADGGGHFTEVWLFPRVKVAKAEMIEKANELHKRANKLCFIANSVNFPVHHKIVCTADEND
ncbi:MAG: OsmC family peroxiredoxin [Sphingobacteriaceae bacterium]|jgi:organic hydroperoxide reductase OsmC/OhrA|nr:OsmC family peroxiredoxin [Sphingobacteriaceae bacterium]